VWHFEHVPRFLIAFFFLVFAAGLSNSRERVYGPRFAGPQVCIMHNTVRFLAVRQGGFNDLQLIIVTRGRISFEIVW